MYYTKKKQTEIGLSAKFDEMDFIESSQVTSNTMEHK